MVHRKQAVPPSPTAPNHGARVPSAAAGRPPTIEDVAREADVSVGTVSNVLNIRGNVAAARITRVQAAIERLGYVPNGVAQSLRRQRSRVVGLCAPLTTSAYFAALLEAFEDIAAAQGYEVMHVLSRQDPALELRRIRALLARKVDGLVVIPTAAPAAAFDAIVQSHVPAVVVDRLSRDERFDYVTVDDYGAMRAAANALLAIGHRRLLYVVRYPTLVTTRRRVAAFRAAIRAVPGATGELAVREPDDAAFAASIGAILARTDRPTAAIASNSALTIALLRILRRERVAIPGDLSLVSFDAPEWADVLESPLAVVRPPVDAIARTAWELLLLRMHQASLPTRRIELQATLELAASVAPPPTVTCSTRLERRLEADG
ncbi:MAG: LacI family DNA-binding transcriptional regulator [Casimicrobiaceae bacterium]